MQILDEPSGPASSAPAAEAPRPRAARRVALMTVAAAVVYGSWAGVANAGHGFAAAARAAMIQGASSAFTTLVISGVIEKLVAWLRPSWSRVPLAAGIAASGTAVFHVGVHFFNGTPRILATVLPSILLGYVFAASYASALQASVDRQRRLARSSTKR